MNIPFSWDLFQLWITIITIILVITNELINPIFSKNQLYVNHKKMRKVTFFFVLIFILTFCLKLYFNFVL